MTTLNMGSSPEGDAADLKLIDKEAETVHVGGIEATELKDPDSIEKLSELITSTEIKREVQRLVSEVRDIDLALAEKRYVTGETIDETTENNLLARRQEIETGILHLFEENRNEGIVVDEGFDFTRAQEKPNLNKTLH